MQLSDNQNKLISLLKQCHFEKDFILPVMVVASSDEELLRDLIDTLTIRSMTEDEVNARVMQSVEKMKAEYIAKNTDNLEQISQ